MPPGKPDEYAVLGNEHHNKGTHRRRGSAAKTEKTSDTNHRLAIAKHGPEASQTTSRIRGHPLKHHEPRGPSSDSGKPPGAGEADMHDATLAQDRC